MVEKWLNLSRNFILSGILIWLDPQNTHAAHMHNSVMRSGVIEYCRGNLRDIMHVQVLSEEHKTKNT